MTPKFTVFELLHSTLLFVHTTGGPTTHTFFYLSQVLGLSHFDHFLNLNRVVTKNQTTSEHLISFSTSCIF